MLLKVGELAKKSGLTVRALHHYDAIGLLTPSARADNGYRLYNRDDIARLHRIQALRGFGLTLADIGAYLTQPDKPLSDIIARQIAMLDVEIGPFSTSPLAGIKSSRWINMTRQKAPNPGNTFRSSRTDRIRGGEGIGSGLWLIAAPLFAGFAKPWSWRSTASGSRSHSWPRTSRCRTDAARFSTSWTARSNEAWTSV